MSDFDKAYEDARVECTALKDVEAARTGAEPLPGERRGTVAGKSRLRGYLTQAMLDRNWRRP